jgi:tetratricopeptide (TPR) repeat protein
MDINLSLRGEEEFHKLENIIFQKNKFKFFIVECDSIHLRKEIESSLSQKLPIDVINLSASEIKSVSKLMSKIENKCDSGNPIFFYGIEDRKDDYIPFLKSLNLQREYLSKLCKKNVFLWVNPATTKDIILYMPDLFAWNSYLFSFKISQPASIEFLTDKHQLIQTKKAKKRIETLIGYFHKNAMLSDSDNLLFHELINFKKDIQAALNDEVNDKELDTLLAEIEATQKKLTDNKMLLQKQSKFESEIDIKQLKFDSLADSLTILLRRLAIMPSANYSISKLEFLLDIADNDKKEFYKNLNKLVKMGWLESSDETYKLHEIIRELILENYKPTYEFYESYIKLIEFLSRIDQVKDNPIDKIILLPFCLEIIKHIHTENEIISNLYGDIASFYEVLGEYKTSVSFFLKAIEIAKKLKNQNLVNAFNNNLANVYLSLGQYEKARDLLEAALKSDLENFGEKHPTVATRQSNLAIVYLSLGQYEKARDLLEAALKSDLENFGEKHPTVATIQSNLATVYRNLGQYEKARDLLEAALKSAMENFGEKHPKVVTIQSNLANVYSDLGQYEKARDLLEASLKSELDNSGEKHPNVAACQSNLANVYSELGQYEKARDLLEAALKSAMENFGEKHPTVATRYNNLGHLYFQTGKLDLALENLLKALLIARMCWGKEHPNTQATLNSIYYVLKIMTKGIITDKDKKAMEILNKVKAILSQEEDMSKYIDFLISLEQQEGISEQNFEKLKPDFKRLYADTIQEIEQEKFWDKLTEHTKIAIHTFRNEKNSLFELNRIKNELHENTHSEIIKYYDFLIEHAKGTSAEELQSTIDKPLWDFFAQIQQMMEFANEK